MGTQLHHLRVRPAGVDDAAACVAIYRPFVEDGAISFETDVPTVADIADRIVACRAHHEWLLAESDGDVVGYAYARGLNSRPAYQWSVETSVYVSIDHHRNGAGRALYQDLLRRLAERGYRRAFAAITQPNDASNAFHQSFGFQRVGLLRRVGWKHDKWHDVAWMELDLADPVAPPPAVS